MVFQQLKTIVNSNFVGMKLAIMGHKKCFINYPRIFPKFLDEKDVKITKRSHAYKGYANTYNVEILNFFKDTESAIKDKLTDLLSELRVLNFMITLALELKKIECDDEI